jgi:hypothetical protein
MSIAVENLPLPHRRRFEYLVPHRYRAAMLRKAKATAPLPHRVQIESNRTATAPRLIEKYPPLPRRHRDGIKNSLDNLLFLVVRKYVL